MKKNLLIVLFVLFAASSAFATPQSWTGTYNPDPNIIIKKDGTWIDEHLVSLIGFNSATDTVTKAWVEIYAYDYENDGAEYAKVNFTTSHADLATWEVDGDWQNPEKKTVYLKDALWGLSDGSTPFSLWASEGDFKFDKIIYYAEGNRVSVPEPATMLLLGIGLAGLAVGGRKKFNL